MFLFSGKAFFLTRKGFRCLGRVARMPRRSVVAAGQSGGERGEGGGRKGRGKGSGKGRGGRRGCGEGGGRVGVGKGRGWWGVTRCRLMVVLLGHPWIIF